MSRELLFKSSIEVKEGEMAMYSGMKSNQSRR